MRCMHFYPSNVRTPCRLPGRRDVDCLLCSSRQIFCDNVRDRTLEDSGSRIKQNCSSSHFGNCRQVVADEQQRTTFSTGSLFHPAEASLLKLGIADCQYLVDDQDVRLQMCGDGKCEPDIHPA